MQRRTKKIILIANFVLIAALMAVVFLFVYFSLSEPLTNKLTSGKPVKFMITFYGTENLHPDILEVFFVYYERDSNLLKVLSVNTDIVVFKKNARARSLKYSFFNSATKDLPTALTTFYQSIFEMTDNSFTPDYYITVSFESLLQMAGQNSELKNLITNRNFENRDLECLNQLEFAQAVMKVFKTGMFSSIKNIRKNWIIHYYKQSDFSIHCASLNLNMVATN